LILGGEGLARLDGIPVFIPRSCPGDRLRVRIVDRRADFARAEIVEILEPGPGRRPDPYPDLAETGAADLQHIDDRIQTLLKAASVREALSRLGPEELPAEMPVRSAEPWHYRLRTQLQVGRDAGGAVVGYFARGTHRIVRLAQCPLLVPELDALLAQLPPMLPHGSPPRLDLAAGDGGSLTVSPPVADLPQGEITTTVGGLAYAYDARCFFQGHRGLIGPLIEAAVGPWEGEAAFDLFAGVGLFTLPLGQKYGRVVGVESEPFAIRYARMNARRNRLANVDVVPQDVDTWSPHLPSQPDRILVDPPRAGLSPRLRTALIERRASRLTYVSCHAATLARDLRTLTVAYVIDSIELFDLFPQTGHMELVVQMQLRSPA
jgi:23S rRNA (uracil1939-C5)-methyltransferase